MNILMVVSEAAPLLRTSGVADVVSELTLQLRRMRHDARIVIPRYRTLSHAGGAEPVIDKLEVPIGSMRTVCSVSRVNVEYSSERTVPIYLLGHAFYFDRETAYGYADDYERFICFTRAVLEMLRHPEFLPDGWMPDVIHGHDWIAGLMPSWLRQTYSGDERLKKTAFAYTIHNAGFPGQCSSRSTRLAGLPKEQGVYMDIGETGSTINFMARGILAADAVNTVSATHAKELQDGHYFPDVAKAIQLRPDRFVGILHGADDIIFSPIWDKAIEKTFDEPHLEWRSANRVALQGRCGLEVNPKIPIFGVVGRLIEEKGFGLVEEVMPDLLEKGEAQFVILGRPGDHHFREAFTEMRGRYRGIFAKFGNDDVLARRTYAGCDVVMVPSLYEPCGLQQILAMRYGAVPLVRRTGGLADTVQPWNQPSSGTAGRGFVFEEFTADALRQSMREAIELFRTDAPKWGDLQSENMLLDFTWKNPAKEYLALYARAQEVAQNRFALPKGRAVKPDPSDLLVQTLLAVNELMTTAAPADYLHHVAEETRELLDLDAVLIWTLDGKAPQQLKLTAASPASVPVENLHSEHNARTWSRQYAYRSDGDEAPAMGLRAQRGFLSSDLAVKLGWKTQISAPISARGLLQGRIDAFSIAPDRRYKDWHFTALTAIANTVGMSLERRYVRGQRTALLKLDREMTEAKTLRNLAEVVLHAAVEATSGDAGSLQMAGMSFVIERGEFREGTLDGLAGGEHDSIHESLEPGDESPAGRIEVIRGSQPFLRWHEDALREICRQASGAFAAALRREREEKARVDQLRDLAQSLVGGDDEDKFLQRIIEKTAEVLQAAAASLYLVDESGQQLKIRAATGYHKPLLEHKDEITYAKGEGLTGWIWQRGEKFKTESVRKLHSEHWKGKYVKLQADREPVTFMGLPLKVVDLFTQEPIVIGVVKFEDREERTGAPLAFSDQDLLLAEMMANIIATAVHNAQISGAQFQKLSRDLGELSNTLVAGQDIRGLVQGVVEKMAETLNARASSLYLLNEASGLLEIRAATGYQAPLLASPEPITYAPGKGVTGWIFEKGEVVRAGSLAQLRAHPTHEGKQNSRQNNHEPDSFLGLPLTVTDRFTKQPRRIGVLKVEDIKPTPAHREAAFTAQDERLVVMMASVIATVVYNTQASEAGFAKLSSDLEKLSGALSGGKEMTDLVQSVVDTTAKTLGAAASSLYLYDPAKGKLKIHAATGYQAFLAGSESVEYSPGEGITGGIYQKGELFLANRREDLARYPSWAGKYDGAQKKQPRTFLGVPLSVVDRYDKSRKVIGVLKIEEIAASTDHPLAEFTTQDVLLVKMMADVIATVVYNTQVGAEQLERFGSNLGQLSDALAGGLETKALVSQVVRTIADVLGASASSLYLYDDATKLLVIMAATGYQEKLVGRRATYAVGEGVTGAVFRDGELFRAKTPGELSKHPNWKGKQDSYQGGRQPDSFLGVPLQVAGKTIGVLKIEDIRKSPNHPEAFFTDQDVRLVTMMANVIATVVYNARAGEARIGGILRRMGILSRPMNVAGDLLSEYAQSTDDGILDQLAIVVAADLDAHSERIEEEARALHAVPSNPAIYRRIADRASDAAVAWKFSIYSSIITSNPGSAWTDVAQAAALWIDLKLEAAGPDGFRDAVHRLMAEFAQRTRLQVLNEPADATWSGAVLDTESLFPAGISRIPLFFLREPPLNEHKRAGLLRAKDSAGAHAIVVLVVWGPGYSEDEIEKLRHDLSPAQQELVVATIDQLIRVLEAPEPAKAFQSLIFRSTRIRSPFVSGGPVPNRMFFGREGEIRQILDEMRAHRSCIILGGRTIGKTSILQRLKRVTFPHSSVNLRAIYHTCETTRTEDEFYEAPILEWTPAPPPHAPRTFAELLANPPEDTVLLLDEIDAWVSDDRRNNWRLFGKLRGLSHDKKLRLVMTGEREVMRTIYRKEGPLGNFGTDMYLGLLDKEAVRCLVVHPFELLEVELVNPETIIDQIYRYTGGHPNLVQRLCIRLVDLMNRQRTRQLRVELVTQVVEGREFLRDDFLHVFWEHKRHGAALENLILILLIRDPSLAVTESIRDAIRRTISRPVDKDQVEGALDRLAKMRSILSAEGGYRFRVPAMLDALAVECATDEDLAKAITTFLREEPDRADAAPV